MSLHGKSQAFIVSIDCSILTIYCNDFYHFLNKSEFKKVSDELSIEFQRQAFWLAFFIECLALAKIQI